MPSPANSDSEASFILVGQESASGSDSPAGPIAPAKPKPNHPSLNHTKYVPGSASTYAHDWSDEGTAGGVRAHGRHFIDGHGRACQLRGVNLGGSCKTPSNDDNATFPHGAKGVTFVGRPFPLEEAPAHLARLRRWGLSFVRFLFTWEAIEHAGPGIYDMEYVQYVRELLSLLPEYGMSAFVSMHQDVWSRYSGGSGAPAWTLESVGFDLHALEEAGAAWLLGVKGGGHVEEERGIWPTGYQKLAAATMATCFWAGDTFVPKLRITDENGSQHNIQQFLQDHFLRAWEVFAKAIGDLPAVLGFEIMNEPHRGYIELKSMHAFDYNTDLHLSYTPSAFQSFQLGAGHPTSVPVYTRSFPMPTSKTSEAVLNEKGRKVWRLDGPSQGECIWAMHGVWGWDRNKNTAVVLRENYFVQHPLTGKEIDWYTDFYYPFVKRWSEIVTHVSSSSKLVFLEAIPNEFCPASWTTENQVPNMVYAPHWYDLNALFAKAFGDFTVNVQGLSRGMFPLRAFYWGQTGARDNFSLQITNIVKEAHKSLGEKPVLIGECGIPMDMNKGEAFDTENFTWQARMMDAMITGLEAALVGFTLWNYNPYNTDPAGDFWNGENFSWFSQRRALPASLLYYEQDAPSLDQGGRILNSVVRPYPAKTAGVPTHFEYEMNSGAFVFEWTSDVDILTSKETEIFLPTSITQGRKLVVDGLGPDDKYAYDPKRQTLYIVTGGDVLKHRVQVKVHPPLRPSFELNDLWSDFAGQIVSVLAVLLAIIAYFVLRTAS